MLARYDIVLVGFPFTEGGGGIDGGAEQLLALLHPAQLGDGGGQGQSGSGIGIGPIRGQDNPLGQVRGRCGGG